MKGTTAKDLRKLNAEELNKKLQEIQGALLVEKKSPKIRPLRKAIARIKTIMSQNKGKETGAKKQEKKETKETKKEVKKEKPVQKKKTQDKSKKTEVK